MVSSERLGDAIGFYDSWLSEISMGSSSLLVRFELANLAEWHIGFGVFWDRRATSTQHELDVVK